VIDFRVEVSENWVCSDMNPENRRWLGEGEVK